MLSFSLIYIYTLGARRRYFDHIREHKRKICLVWIFSHSGIKGNEVAVSLAKVGAREKSSRELRVSYGDIKVEYKKEARISTHSDEKQKRRRVEGSEIF